uniref:G-protein coupled receptors family 1 profile domain-containing protein n=1 Tax=Plectus sambesii TaxID=2011161 RepID=A0A914WAZ4_9BILA
METPCDQAAVKNAYWDSKTNPSDQSVVTAGLLPAFLTYSICGGIASVFNIVCILVFLTKKDLRDKYLFFALLAFGNLPNTLFCLIAGSLRRKMIFANKFLQLRSTFECLQQSGPHLQLASFLQDPLNIANTKTHRSQLHCTVEPG